MLEDADGLSLDRLTFRARQVFVLAQEEARRVGSELTRSEHVLLAVVRLGGVGGHALKRLGVTAQGLRVELARSGVVPGDAGLRRMVRQAQGLAGEDLIGTEQLLLGLVAAPNEGRGAAVLARLGVISDDFSADDLRLALNSVRRRAEAKEHRSPGIFARAWAMLGLYRSSRRIGHGRRLSLWAADIVLFPRARLNRLYLAKSLRDWRLTPAVYGIEREIADSRRAALWSAACSISISDSVADLPTRRLRRLRRCSQH